MEKLLKALDELKEINERYINGDYYDSKEILAARGEREYRILLLNQSVYTHAIRSLAGL